MRGVIESGHLHPISAVRRAWLQLSVLGWFAWDNRSVVGKIADEFGVWGLIWAAAVLTAVITTIVFASWRKTSFTLTADHLEYRYGLIWQVQRRIQVSQIRTVDIEHPLFGRPLGVRALTFSTASGPTKLAYLGPRAASRLHDAVIAQTGARSAKKRDGEGIVSRVTAADLALSILLDAEVVLGLVVGGVVSFVPFFFSGHALTLSLALPWIRSAWRSVGRRFPRHHGWVVREVDAGYRTEFGLFNKGQYTWQRDRISSITLHQPLLWRSRNWVRVTGGIVGHEDLLLVPVATRAQAEKMLVHIYGPDVLKVMHAPEHASRRARWCTPWWRSCAFSLTQHFAAGWRGLFLKQTITVAPVSRVLGTHVTQGPWQRLHGVAHVVLALPGGTDVKAVNRDAEAAAEIAASMRRSCVQTSLAGEPIARRAAR
ncbi:PH domain-containing protein [Streptomyces anulatus]|uniref:PH domain-containing protein n=1 Tax=Streptomyces anulatus TaxID=1892 RepID=UPI001C2644FB|nr:PH domain-containing protein [Streptomyces anulatus]